ncbi:MAG: hypothetical protein M0R47_08470 [Methylobacter sp.]|jgi:hypothetical protein|uniref:hypothetical protein n=1 Tax=Methylobacter sp. TaxID=2051955 RepID=UPI0025F2896B|nr:hypothetical protein [Methylobacter sp.]MCK9620553.1 hypothetical protein [Methylobacter sp.]
MKILFNDVPNEDVVSILVFIEGIASKLCIEEGISIDVQKIETIVEGIRRDFPHNDGLSEASAFKKVANFISYFVAEKPILESFKKSQLPSDILNIRNYENSIVALLIGLSALHNAVIHQNGTTVTINNPIELSKHSLIDIVDALANITPLHHFKLLTVLLEQLSYKTNPHCQYQTTQFM